MGCTIVRLASVADRAGSEELRCQASQGVLVLRGPSLASVGWAVNMCARAVAKTRHCGLKGMEHEARECLRIHPHIAG